jgi:hypothetical protein
MAGVNFMSFIEGRRLAEQDNIRDEKHWREQMDAAQAYDIREQTYANTERDQAYKEQIQGYALTDTAAKADQMEANRLVGDSYAIAQKAAQAQGKPLVKVLLESPMFELQGATERMSANFQAGWRDVLQQRIIPALRIEGDFEAIQQLSNKFGLVDRSGMAKAATYADQNLARERLNALYPNAPRNANGDYQLGGVWVPESTALGLSYGGNIQQTAINLQKQADVNAANAGIQDQTREAVARAQDQADRSAVVAAIRSGDPTAVALLTPSQRAIMQGAYPNGLPTAAAPQASVTALPSVASATDMPAMPVTPGVSPTGSSAKGSSAAPVTPPTANLDAMSTVELINLRNRLMTEKNVPGLSAAEILAITQRVNELVQYRQTPTYTRSMPR